MMNSKTGLINPIFDGDVNPISLIINSVKSIQDLFYKFEIQIIKKIS